MRKLKIFVIVIGALLLFVGGGLLALSIVRANASEDSLITETKEITESFSDIDVNLSETDFIIKKSADEKCSVEIVERTKVKHDVEVSDNKLTVKNNDLRQWYEKYFFNFNFKSMKITLFVPQSDFNNLSIKNDTGDTIIEDGFQFNSIKINSSTGEVVLKNIKATDYINLNLSTGSISISDTTANSLKLEASTGDINLDKTVITISINIHTSTGDVHFNECDAEILDIHTSTGSVKGSLLTGKSFTTKTSTGRVDVPNTTGGSCNIETSTGDIVISIVNN